MAKSVTSEKIQFKDGRLSFPVLDKPKQFRNEKGEASGEPKYSYTILLDPSNKEQAVTIARIKAEGKRIAAEKWEDAVPKSIFQPGSKFCCYGDGNDLDKVYDGYEDMFFIRVSSANPIVVVGRRKDPQTGKFVQLKPGDSEWPYAGCHVNGSLSIWTQDGHGRKSLNGNAIALQFSKKGEAFGGGAPVDPDAEFVEDETTDDAFG